MTHFRLIGRDLLFQVVRRGLYSGIDCVLGHTMDGKLQTLARVADVVPCNEDGTKATV